MSNFVVKAEYGEEKLVAFLDVLGFKELLKEKDRIELYFNKVIDILKALKNVNSKSELEYALISDSVVVSFPYGGDLENVNEFLIALGRIQAELCLENIWLRGAVTVGEITMQENSGSQVVFGKALSDAYTLESEYAKYPRILIDPRVFGKLNTNREDLMTKLNEMNVKSKYFQNILFDPSVTSFFHQKDIPGTSIANDGAWINFFEYIRIDASRFTKFINILKENIYSGQKHFEKYKWIQSYCLMEYNSKGNILKWDSEATRFASL